MQRRLPYLLLALWGVTVGVAATCTLGVYSYQITRLIVSLMDVILVVGLLAFIVVWALQTHAHRH